MRNLENKVIYQIYPKSFKDTTGNGYGDINGIIEKLDYLKDLGVDYIWLSPCCKSPQKDNGYDISDYMKIDELFGTNADYENLIAESNKRGIKIMMDLVLNHTSDQHEWFKKACEGDSKYYNYYIWRDEPNELKSVFGGSAWTYNEKVGKYYLHFFDVSQPDLNWQNEEVRKDLYKMINYWIDKGVEGFRLDVIDLIGKEPENLIANKGPRFYEYLKELNNNTFKDKLLTVGECWGSTLEESYKMCNKDGLTQAFNFNNLTITHGKSKWDQKELSLEKLCECLDIWQNKYTGIDTLVMNNHDIPRLISLWLDDKEYREKSSKLLISIWGLLKGNLYIYQGEEIGMTNANLKNINEYNDVETFNTYNELKEKIDSEEEIMEIIAKVSRDNARVPMQWNSEDNAGFTTGTPWLKVNSNYKEINVEKDLKNNNSIYNYYKEIIKFRKENYDLISQEAEFKCKDGVFIMNKGNISLVANFTNLNKNYKNNGQRVFGNYDDLNNELRPFEVRVIKK